MESKTFDVIIIGGGINGASAGQHLAAAGYNCLIVDKGDFGSGASGRSSRMLHIGLRFFEARNPVRYFALNPGRFIDALRGARQAIQAVGEHLPDAGDRIWPYRMCFPIYDDAEFKGWHVNAGLKLLQWLGGGRVALDPEIVTRDHGARVPFFGDFRDPERLRTIALYNEYKFDWPERFCVDMVLDAERNGATVVNHSKASLGERSADDLWPIVLQPMSGDGDPVTVYAPLVLNMAGTWIDDVLPGNAGKLVHATKGAHLIVEMPDRYRGFGIAALNSLGLPFYVLPLHGSLFSIGVTETPFEGDASDVSASDEDIDFLISQANSLLPGRTLTRKDVHGTWAGVRPLTATGTSGKPGRAPRTLHDLEVRGLPGVFALTGGPIMTHRSAGRMALDAVSRKMSPSGAKGSMSTAPFVFSGSQNSPPVLEDHPDVRAADLELAVTREHAKTLTDVLVRRTDLAWRRALTQSEAKIAAGFVASAANWPHEKSATEVAEFMDYQQNAFQRPVPDNQNDRPVQKGKDQQHDDQKT